MSELESKTLTITADWSTEFQAIKGTPKILTSVKEIKTESDFLVEISLMMTPGTRKKNSFAGEEFEGLQPSWKNQKYDCSLPCDPIDLKVLINEGIKKGVVTSTVSKTLASIQEMVNALAEAFHHERWFTLDDNCKAMIGVIQTMQSRIGSAGNLGERLTAPTLLVATAFTEDDHTKMAHDLSVLHRDSVKSLEA
jgi:hypothetical protein